MTSIPIMPRDEERFMAFGGLVQWTLAVVSLAARLSEAQKHLGSGDLTARRLATCSFHTECNYFAIAANKLLEFKEWALSFGLCATIDFSEVDAFSRRDIKDLRNMREHVVDYFKGDGHSASRWIVETPEYKADASSFVGTLIGGRLDWPAFGTAAQRLLPKLLAEPIPYPPPQNMPPPPEPPPSMRLFPCLDVLTGGDKVAAIAWLTTYNAELGCIPGEKTRGSVEGLAEVVAYLEGQIRHKSEGGAQGWP
jgi:hypothetical protein